MCQILQCDGDMCNASLESVLIDHHTTIHFNSQIADKVIHDDFNDISSQDISKGSFGTAKTQTINVDDITYNLVELISYDRLASGCTNKTGLHEESKSIVKEGKQISVMLQECETCVNKTCQNLEW